MPPPRPPLPRYLVYPALLALVFGAIAPTLSTLEFSSSMENLNIATALELRRDHAPGDWLIPTLEGEPRIKKPPLTAWLTAHAISPATVADLSSPDPAVRRAAADRLAWQSRWPSLLAACLMILATYELGRAIADPTVALAAALIAASSLMFLKFGRAAMVDVHLALWVTVANAALAHAILHGRRWAGCCVAGLALGFAFMIKGPVAWVQTLLPALAYGLFVWYRDYRGRRRVDFGPSLAPALVGLLLMAAVGLPWFLYVYWHVPHAMDTWLHQAVEERSEKPAGPLAYFAFFGLMMPWTVFLIGGVIHARRGMILAVLLALLPLLVMSFYKDRKERYVFPMTAPAAVLAANGLVTLARKREAWTKLEKFVVAQHWTLLVLIGVVLPAVATTIVIPKFQTANGQPLLGRGLGAGLTVGLGLTIAGLMLVRQRWPVALVAATVGVTFILQAAAMPGYAKTTEGLSPMRPLADAIWAAWPDAEMLNAHPKGKRASVDLSIYMNRPTRWLSMLALHAAQPTTRPSVVVMQQRLKEKDPDPAPPPGWQYVHKVQRDDDLWWAFAQPPAGAAATRDPKP